MTAIFLASLVAVAAAAVVAAIAFLRAGRSPFSPEDDEARSMVSFRQRNRAWWADRRADEMRSNRYAGIGVAVDERAGEAVPNRVGKRSREPWEIELIDRLRSGRLDR